MEQNVELSPQPDQNRDISSKFYAYFSRNISFIIMPLPTIHLSTNVDSGEIRDVFNPGGRGCNLIQGGGVCNCIEMH